MDQAIDTVKPTIDEVVAHAQKKINYHLSQLPRTIPEWEREEMSQNALLRVVEKYESIDASKGWKTYVDTHCWGAIQDYQKSGQGFEENKQTYKQSLEDREDSNDPDSPKEKKVRGISFRVEVKDKDDENENLGIDAVLGLNGKSYSDDHETDNKIKWDLVSRMASVDHTIHLVAKIILDFDIAELANTFGVTRERLSQRYHAFLAECKSPAYARDSWLNQALYAFGIGDDIQDNGLGWDHQPIDLYSLRPIDPDYGIHKSAMDWVKELFPDLLAVKEAAIQWDLVSRLARYDESLHMVAAVLLGKTQREICEYFDISVTAARRKIHRFIDKMDSPIFYEDKWVKQVIYVLGLNATYNQKIENNNIGLLSDSIDLMDFETPRSTYDRGVQLTFVLISGEKTRDGSEIKKTRSLRKLDEEREEDCSTQVNLLDFIS